MAYKLHVFYGYPITNVDLVGNTELRYLAGSISLVQIKIPFIEFMSITCIPYTHHKIRDLNCPRINPERVTKTSQPLGALITTILLAKRPHQLHRLCDLSAVSEYRQVYVRRGIPQRAVDPAPHEPLP